MRAVDELLTEAMNTRIAQGGTERPAELIDYGDRVEIVVDVGMAEPSVRYSDGKFIVEYDGRTKEFDVPGIDKESIEASIVNGILSIKARRGESVGEDKESAEEKRDSSSSARDRAED